MAFKFVILAAFVAAANAGLIGSPVAYSAGPVAYSGYGAPSVYSHGVAAPALVSQQNNILRTPGNLGQVSTYSKTITTPYSSVSKSDVRVSNDALAYPGYAAPAYHGYAAPAYSAYAAPVAKVAAPVAYAAAPAYSAYAAPVARYAAAPAVAAHGSLLGVAYSAAPAVAHMTYSNGLGLTYAY